MHVFAACLGAAILSFAPAKTHAQMGFGPRGGSREMENIVPRFDADKDGRLDDAERKSAREYIRSQGFNRGAGRSSGSLNAPQASARSTLESDLQLSATSAPATRKNLYDESTLRTLYIRFSGSDWYEELSDFYGTGVEVPADLVLDGKVYRSVGVRFRGNSSYGMTGSSPKKPIGVSVDYEDDAQRLYGYRTLNLLNANADPSFMREALFSRISRQYIPTPRANFIRVVINGESWGVYVNAQQFNKDFLDEWFDTTAGVRWKVPAGRGTGGALAYLGADPASYRSSYELLSGESEEAWRDLISLCEKLYRTPDERLGPLVSCCLG